MTEFIWTLTGALTAFGLFSVRLIWKKDLRSPISFFWGLGSIILFWFLHSADGTIYFLVECSVLAIFLIASAEDFKTRTVLDWQIIIAGICSIGLILMDKPVFWIPLGGAFLALAVTGIPFLLTREKGIGLGDVLFFTITGGLTGISGVFIALSLAGISGLFYAFIMKITRQEIESIPLVPFFMLAWILTTPISEVLNLILFQTV